MKSCICSKKDETVPWEDSVCEESINRLHTVNSPLILCLQIPNFFGSSNVSSFKYSISQSLLQISSLVAQF